MGSINTATNNPAPIDTTSEAEAEQAIETNLPDAANVVRRRILAVQNSDGTQAATDASAPTMAVAQTLPVLPTHPQSDVSSTKDAALQTASLAAGSGNGGPDTVTGSMAAWLMLEATLKTQQGQNNAQIAQEKAANAAGLASAEAQIKQISADKNSAIVNLLGSGLGAVVPYGAMRMGGDTAQAWAQASGQVISSTFDAGSKNFGPGATSYDAQIEQKQDDLAKQINTQASQSSQRMAKQADSAVDMALRTLSEYFQRRTQTENNIAANV